MKRRASGALGRALVDARERTSAVRTADPFVAVVSGKGGVGKTNLATNLAIAAAGLGARVLLVDGDLGLANVDVLLGLVPSRDVEDVLDGRCALEAALIDGPRGIRILPAAAGRSELSALAGPRLTELVARLRGVADDFDLVLVDAGAGVGPSVVGLAAACARALVVTTPEPTSLADAYATLKVLRRAAPSLPVEVVVNQASNEADARAVHARLDRLACRFLAGGVDYRGHLPADPHLAEAVRLQRAVVELFPAAPVSRRLAALAEALLRDHGGRSAAAPRPARPQRRPKPAARPATQDSRAGAPSCTRN